MGQHFMAFKKERSPIHWEDGLWVDTQKDKVILLAGYRNKHLNPHVSAEWFLFKCPGKKNGKQVELLAAQN